MALFVFFAGSAGALFVSANFPDDFSVAMFVFFAGSTGALLVAGYIAPCLWISRVYGGCGIIFTGGCVNMAGVK